MTIDELDEWQGMTADMVREWLDKEGVQRFACPSFPVCPELGEHTHHGPTINSLVTIPDDLFGNRWQAAIVSSSVGWLALQRGLSVQALIREINPRMRGPGYPSDAAARAHGDGSWWVFQHQAGATDPRNVVKLGELHMAQMCLSAASNAVRFYWERGLMGEPCDEACLWWPCDANGNKVRWPVDAEGNML